MASPSGGTYPVNSVVTQTVGVNSTAVGYVASWDKGSGVLRYYHPTGLSTSSAYSYKILPYREVRISKESEIEVRGKTRFLGYYEEEKLFQE